MPAANFTITDAPDNGRGYHQIITGGEPGITLHLYQLRAHTVRVNPDELQFYGQAGHRLLLFETEAWRTTKLKRFTDAIAWYGASIGYPNMEISLEPKKFRLRLI